MFILKQKTKQSKNKIITGRPLANELAYWLTLKSKKLNSEQNNFVIKVAEITGGYNHLDVELDGNDFNVHLTVTDKQRLQLDNVFRPTEFIVMDNPVKVFPNILKITFKL